MNTPHFLAHMSEPVDHIILHGVRRTVVPLGSLEARAFNHKLAIKFPPPGGPGWAVGDDGADRLAAWFEGGAA